MPVYHSILLRDYVDLVLIYHNAIYFLNILAMHVSTQVDPAADMDTRSYFSGPSELYLRYAGDVVCSISSSCSFDWQPYGHCVPLRQLNWQPQTRLRSSSLSGRAFQIP